VEYQFAGFGSLWLSDIFILRLADLSLAKDTR